MLPTEEPARTPQRIQLRRSKGWRKPEGAIVVARPSRWGNPYSIDVWGRDLALELFNNTVRGFWIPSLLAWASDAQVDAAYEAHTTWSRRIGHHPTDAARAELRGHDLACWCAPALACHANVLLLVANRPGGDA